MDFAELEYWGGGGLEFRLVLDNKSNTEHDVEYCQLSPGIYLPEHRLGRTAKARILHTATVEGGHERNLEVGLRHVLRLRYMSMTCKGDRVDGLAIVKHLHG